MVALYRRESRPSEDDNADHDAGPDGRRQDHVNAGAGTGLVRDGHRTPETGQVAAHPATGRTDVVRLRSRGRDRLPAAVVAAAILRRRRAAERGTDAPAARGEGPRGLATGQRLAACRRRRHRAPG